MQESIIQKLMTPGHDGKIPGMKHNLQPQKIEQLGKNAQVWAVHIFGIFPKIPRVTVQALELVGVGLYRLDGDTPQEIYLTAADFPARPSPEKEIYSFGDLMTGQKKPGATFYGLSVADFVDTIYSHLPKVTKKTRVRLVAFGTTENYGPLNLNDLDARLSLDPTSGGNFALGFADKEKHQGLRFLELGAFFPEQDLAEIARRFFLSPDQQKQADTQGGIFSEKKMEAEIIYFPRPKNPRRDPEKTKAYVMEQARLTWAVFSELRRVMLDTFQLDPAVYGTPANCAARAYTAHYLKERISGRSYFIRLQAMRSYWGGRMECFYRGNFKGHVSVYDAVSLYPQACINLGSLPTSESWYRLNRQNLMTCGAGVCRVEFEFPAGELFPCLPVQAGGRTFYPLAGVSDCTVHEVRYALERGASIKTLEGWAYDFSEGDTSLADFSRDLLKKKNIADAQENYAARTIFKLLMNSLYGKFGQQYAGDFSLETYRKICRDYDFSSVQELIEIDHWQEMILEEGGEIVPEEKSTGNYWHPEWVALINGYARFVESKAMSEGDYLTLAGTTDSIVIAHDPTLPESFKVEGVTFRREISGDTFTGVRSRFYVVSQGGEVVKAALLGAPRVAGVAEKIVSWGMDWKTRTRRTKAEREELEPDIKKALNMAEEKMIFHAPRVEKVRDGLLTGSVIGLHDKEKWAVSLHADTGREYLGDYSRPLPGVLDIQTDEEKATYAEHWRDFREFITEGLEQGQQEQAETLGRVGWQGKKAGA